MQIAGAMPTDNDSIDEPTDMLTTFAKVGLLVSPAGGVDLSDITAYRRWSWGSASATDRLGERELYMFEVEAVLNRLLHGDRPFALCHAGHGANSYALSLVTTKGPVAAFVQHLWGGVYMDPLQQGFGINQTYARLHELFARIAEPEANVRWVLLYSGFRSVCGVVDLRQYQLNGSFDESYVRIRDSDHDDEGALFEYLLDVPGLLREPNNRESEWRFPRRGRH